MDAHRPFADRREAGRALAASLRHLADRPALLVMGLPRGGVPVAHEVARALHAPLAACIVRKLGVPGHEEVAMGALASGGAEVLDAERIRRLHINESQIREVRRREAAELARREALYLGPRGAPPVRGRTVIAVDDGVATGATLHAALLALRGQAPAWLVAAAPVGAPDAARACAARATRWSARGSRRTSAPWARPMSISRPPPTRR